MISILVGNLPEIKNQIKENVVGWYGQPSDIIQPTTQFGGKLEATNFYKTRNMTLEAIQIPSLHQSCNLTYSSENTCQFGDIKNRIILNLRKRKDLNNSRALIIGKYSSQKSILEKT